MIPIGALALADLALIVDAFSNRPHFESSFVPLHLVLTIVALMVSHRQVSRQGGWDCLAFPLGAAIGPCAMLLIYLAKPWSIFARQVVGSVVPSFSGRKMKLCGPVTPKAILARMLDRRITFPAADQVESLSTILRSGHVAARRRALETAVRSFEPRLSPLIAAALRDEDQTIRALAAAAAAQVGHNLNEQLTELDDTKPSMDKLYTRAMLYFDHGCHNVLLPEPLRANYRRGALEDLQACRRRARADDHRLPAIVDALGVLGVELSPTRLGKPQLVHFQEQPSPHGC